ncbi:hypothetical protein [Desulfallas gibsoniae]|uniref:4Fe-4S ferredoxin-type domain-containing protein n=1 Tax=Desulfoscipio gibsoniae DSM 7213 TaxID=767817 RepID=R4KEB0_9FIRM|nr:hypothetical protein Desgi_1431 [Desulfoscipio gibsoniae DSM 7213]
MIANYGYKDGAGEFFISIDTEKCASCVEKPCVKACPEQIFYIYEDDYDDEVVGVRDKSRNQLQYICAPCKPSTGEPKLTCTEACTSGAIKHSW